MTLSIFILQLKQEAILKQETNVEEKLKQEAMNKEN